MRALRGLHGLIKLVFAASIISAGVLVYMYPTSVLWDGFTSNSYVTPNELYRQIGGVAAAAIAFLAFLPRLPKRKRGKEITFEGSHGEVTVQLEPVEKVMENVIEKLPEVKQVSVTIKPTDDPGQVVVYASTVLFKDGNGDARQITARVNSFIQSHTRKILGLQDIKVKLRVTRWLMRMKTVKPGPLLLEAPNDETQAPSRPVVEAVAPIQAPPPQARVVTEIPAELVASVEPEEPAPPLDDVAAVRQEVLADAVAEVEEAVSFADFEDESEEESIQEEPESEKSEESQAQQGGTGGGSPLDALVEKTGGNRGPLWTSSEVPVTEATSQESEETEEEQPSRGW